ncbi:unnamed protein product [Amoebophrya sp. A120]|nr:unnamed protein product [Amoebophrya sp. A120]|eukprot:GSA120T00016570001.1
MSAFETVFGLKGKGFAIVCADSQMQAHQIIAIKTDEDKIMEVENKLFGCNGPSADRTSFMDYISKNITLYRLRNQVGLSTKAAATFTRNELATALRKGPYQCDLVVAGYDEENQDAELYFMDSYASCAKVNKAAHSYAGNFVHGILDKEWKEGLTEKEGLTIIKKCITEIRTRFALGRLDAFIIKIVDKNGVRHIKQKDL